MKPTTRTLLVVLRVVIGLGLLAYLGGAGIINWSALLGLIAFWPLSLAALMLLLVDIGLTSWRLCLLLRPRGLHLALSSSVRLTLIGTFFNICLPGATGGDVVRLYYATAGNHGRRAEIATVILLDRAIGMFALLLLPVLVTPLFGQMLQSIPVIRGLLGAAAAMATMMLAVMGVCSARRVRHSCAVSWLCQHLPLGSVAGRMIDTVHAYRYNMLILLGTVGLSLVVHAIMVGAVLLSAQITNATGASGSMALLIPLGFLANSLPVTPGGLGIGETAFAKLFELAGLSGGAEALLGWRMLMMVISLLGLVCYLWGGKRFFSEHTNPPTSEGQCQEVKGVGR